MSAPPPSCVQPRHNVLQLDAALPAENARFACLLLDCLAQGLDVRFQVRGASMTPFIRDGDVVEAAPARLADMTLGAIVLALGDGDALLLHRIVTCRRHPDGIRCRLRGDAHVVDDGWFLPERLPGVVRLIERGDRKRSTSSPTMRCLGRLWVFFTNVRAVTLRLVEGSLRRLRQGLRAAE